jgi:NADH:ubiquinone reductase (non-electrogenic)
MYSDLYPSMRIRVIEGREILSMFDTTLRNWAKRRLGSEGVDVITGASVTKLEPSVVHLQDGRKFPYGLCVWSTGVAPRKVTAMLDPCVFSKDKGGRLNADAHLRVLSASQSSEPQRKCT